MRSDESKGPAADDRTKLGLCARCRFHRTQRSSRGSAFHRCERAGGDPSFPRYPPMPVVHCRGFEPEEDGREP
ncbi:MAG: hypothetical protein R3F35_23155 [Myxococcota bacterium]